MVQIPTYIVGEFLDNDAIESKTKDVGIFRPAFVENNPDKFAIICHGWERNITFDYKIITNDITETISQNFITNGITYKIFDIKPETLYKIIYVNPIIGNVEKWEFLSSNELKNIAKLELK
jgi:hypothetical protein